MKDKTRKILILLAVILIILTGIDFYNNSNPLNNYYFNTIKPVIIKSDDLVEDIKGLSLGLVYKEDIKNIQKEDIIYLKTTDYKGSLGKVSDILKNEDDIYLKLYDKDIVKEVNSSRYMGKLIFNISIYTLIGVYILIIIALGLIDIRINNKK